MQVLVASKTVQQLTHNLRLSPTEVLSPGRGHLLDGRRSRAVLQVVTYYLIQVVSDDELRLHPTLVLVMLSVSGGQSQPHWQTVTVGKVCSVLAKVTLLRQYSKMRIVAPVAGACIDLTCE